MRLWKLVASVILSSAVVDASYMKPVTQERGLESQKKAVKTTTVTAIVKSCETGSRTVRSSTRTLISKTSRRTPGRSSSTRIPQTSVETSTNPIRETGTGTVTSTEIETTTRSSTGTSTGTGTSTATSTSTGTGTRTGTQTGTQTGTGTGTGTRTVTQSSTSTTSHCYPTFTLVVSNSGTAADGTASISLVQNKDVYGDHYHFGVASTADAVAMFTLDDTTGLLYVNTASSGFVVGNIAASDSPSLFRFDPGTTVTRDGSTLTKCIISKTDNALECLGAGKSIIGYFDSVLNLYAPGQAPVVTLRLIASDIGCSYSKPPTVP